MKNLTKDTVVVQIKLRTQKALFFLAAIRLDYDTITYTSVNTSF